MMQGSAIADALWDGKDDEVAALVGQPWDKECRADEVLNRQLLPAMDTLVKGQNHS